MFTQRQGVKVDHLAIGNCNAIQFSPDLLDTGNVVDGGKAEGQGDWMQIG